MIPRIEDLSPNGEIHLSVDGEVFMHADIPVVDARAGHAIKARSSEGRSRTPGKFAVHEVHRVDGRIYVAGAVSSRLTNRLSLQPVVAVRTYVLVCQRISAVAIRVCPDL